MDDFSIIDEAIHTFREVDIYCKVHGNSRGSSVLGHPPKCKKCIEDAVLNESRVQREQAAALAVTRRTENAFKKSGIPDRYVHATFARYVVGDNPDRIKTLSIARMFSDSIGRGWKSLVFYGTPGTGKTHLMISILLEAIEKGMSVRYVSFPLLVDRVMRTRSFGSDESREDVLNDLAGPDILAIDEVGVVGQANADDHALATAYDVINARYNVMKPVLITSNGEIKDLRMILGSRVIERLHENDGRFLFMDWPSYRKERRFYE